MKKNKKLFNKVSIWAGIVIGAATTAEALYYAIDIVKKARQMKKNYRNVVQEFLFINNMTTMLEGNHPNKYIVENSFVGMDPNVDVIQDLQDIQDDISVHLDDPHYLDTTIKNKFKKIGKKYHNLIFSLYLTCLADCLVGKQDSNPMEYLCDRYNKFFKKYVAQFKQTENKAKLLKTLLNL